MMKFKSKPKTIEASRFLANGLHCAGVCRLSCYPFDGDDEPHVHTIHNNQPVKVVSGDWIVAEPDGEHFYPVKAEIFAKDYEAI